EDVTVAIAADDFEHLAALAGPEDLRLSLSRVRPGAGGLRLKFYRQNQDIALSDTLPMMDNKGLRVVSAHTYGRSDHSNLMYIQDFEVETSNPDADIADVDEDFEDAFARIWHGDAENDGFNRLILGAGLSWRQVAMLRAYSKYLQQVGVPFSQSYVEE